MNITPVINGGTIQFNTGNVLSTSTSANAAAIILAQAINTAAAVNLNSVFTLLILVLYRIFNQY
jgi:hypothetical protein